MIDLTAFARRPLMAFATAAALPAATLLPAPAAAQSTSETVRFVTVVGDEDCPASTADEIVVCAHYEDGEQYRLPEDFRGDVDSAPNQAWVNRVKTMDELGEKGALSCSPAGLGGYTGCTQEMIDAYYAQKDKPSAGRASEIINATREERLADVDAEAEAEEARVQEAIQRQQELREQRDAEPLAVPDDELMDAAPE